MKLSAGHIRYLKALVHVLPLKALFRLKRKKIDHLADLHERIAGPYTREERREMREIFEEEIRNRNRKLKKIIPAD